MFSLKVLADVGGGCPVRLCPGGKNQASLRCRPKEESFVR